MLFFYFFGQFRFLFMDTKILFGLNLKRFRKNNHLSQDQLSEKVDISVKHLSKIERGLTFVSADLLEKLSNNLGVSIARLFCKENENIYDENVLNKLDRITEKHLIKAMEGIKGDIRQDTINE
jgi:transcriptional regulator with XRE-family HTH domain